MPRLRQNSKKTKEPAKTEATGILPHLRHFFDRDGNGKISLGETYGGFRRLDVGRLSSAAIALGLNFSLGPLMRTNPLAMDLARMRTFRHDGDSGIVDSKGTYHPEVVDALFAQHAHKFEDALTLPEVLELRRDNLRREHQGFVGPFDRVATLGEWLLLWYVGGEKQHGKKLLKKDTVQDFYTKDDLFDHVASRNQQQRAARDRTLLGKAENAFHSWVF